MNFWDRIDEARSHTDVLRHPFYVRWSEGKLTRGELACYAGQYRHAVVALADAAANAASAAPPELRAELQAHAAEEHDHIAMWDRFARALGATDDDAPVSETSACTRTWAGSPDRPLLESLVAMYTIEAGQPAISETKLAGLRAHYGIDDPGATAYFEVHVERDIEHARAARTLIEERLADADQQRLLVQAEAVLRGNWNLLDGVERISHT